MIAILQWLVDRLREEMDRAEFGIIDPEDGE